jgi:hypothetical protein
VEDIWARKLGLGIEDATLAGELQGTSPLPLPLEAWGVGISAFLVRGLHLLLVGYMGGEMVGCGAGERADLSRIGFSSGT